MSDEIDWKAKCRKVAEWMGRLIIRPRGDVSMWERCSSRVFVADDDTAVWPDYTQDDADAWRLLMALPGQACFIDGELCDVIQHDGERSYIQGRGGLSTQGAGLSSLPTYRRRH
jgi:hypothetical protein